MYETKEMELKNRIETISSNPSQYPYNHIIKSFSETHYENHYCDPTLSDKGQKSLINDKNLLSDLGLQGQIDNPERLLFSLLDYCFNNDSVLFNNNITSEKNPKLHKIYNDYIAAIEEKIKPSLIKEIILGPIPVDKLTPDEQVFLLIHKIYSLYKTKCLQDPAVIRSWIKNTSDNNIKTVRAIEYYHQYLIDIPINGESLFAALGQETPKDNAILVYPTLGKEAPPIDKDLLIYAALAGEPKALLNEETLRYLSQLYQNEACKLDELNKILGRTLCKHLRNLLNDREPPKLYPAQMTIWDKIRSALGKPEQEAIGYYELDHFFSSPNRFPFYNIHDRTIKLDKDIIKGLDLYAEQHSQKDTQIEDLINLGVKLLVLTVIVLAYACYRAPGSVSQFFSTARQ